MDNSLVIVESPAKSKTLERYLGKGFEVLASYGHVRDLLPKKGAVDPENNFSMKYELVEKSTKAVSAITRALKKADNLYLATDPDREGEAISWHLHEILKEKGCLKNKKVHRVVFHEITKSAVREAIENPRQLSVNLVDAQQARRALDYLVGFNLSPLLWKKIQRGLSAGRVQSPALRMLAEREDEIDKFQRKEYWTIEADLVSDKKAFLGRLVSYENEKLKQFSITTADHSEEIKLKLNKIAKGELFVESVINKERNRQPPAPFITSSLQQEAVRKLGFTAQKTMRIAQQLYEGIDVGDGSVGLISYMRTDSVNLAKEAIGEIRALIVSRYGKELLPTKARIFKTKAKNAQEAHEAIRSTSVKRIPSEIKSYLSNDQFKLYELIWKRTMACQMRHATIYTVTVELKCGEGNYFRANGHSIAVLGFMKVYSEGIDEVKKSEENEKILPKLKSGDRVEVSQIRNEQHFTEPPPRYSEASLVKTLEEYGIGRPSTYANIISTLISREYVSIESKRFFLTDIGKIVNNFLTVHFNDYVDYDFTAKMEDELDAISRGEKKWLLLMKEFWKPFIKQVLDKEKNVSRDEVNNSRVLGVDPKSGKEVSVRIGRYGPYAQIGTKDDEDKPKFAGLRDEQKLDSINLEEALELFKLPRVLGVTDDKEEVSANIGRFGPYIRYDNKFISIKKDDDPYTITLDKALELICEKKKIDAEKEINVFKEDGISVLNGRYGPYVTNGKKNVKIPKDKDPKKITLEEAKSLIEKAPVSRFRPRTKRKKRTKATSS